MAERFRKGQLEQAREIDRRMKEVFGLDYWKPQMGDFCVQAIEVKNGINHIDNTIFLVICVSFYAPYEIIVRPLGNYESTNRWFPAVEFIPILSWVKCRALLEEMGWIFSYVRETPMGVKEKFVRLGFRYLPHINFDSTLKRGAVFKNAPTDHEAIMLVLKEVLEMKAKEQADE